MIFADRRSAGRRLAARLERLRGPDLLVLGLPRGGVPVAAEVAEALGAPLDVIVVRKVGVPFQPELAMGAVGEGDVLVVDREIRRLARVDDGEFDAIVARERAEVQRRSARFRMGRPPLQLAGRTALIVDDGIASGSTALAACRVARALGAARVVVAVPVAPAGWERKLGSAADDLECLVTPQPFDAVGLWYRDFAQTSDEEVIACLAAAAARQTGLDSAGRSHGVSDPAVTLTVDGVTLGGYLALPDGARGLVVFAHGSGSSRHSPRNRFVASVLQDAGLGTLLFDLLTAEEERDRGRVFDIGLLAGRLGAVTEWLRRRPEAEAGPIGLFGASTGAAAALWAAAEPGADVAAVVSRGGRPDLAGPRLGAVRAPTLLIVGGHDRLVLDLNREAQTQLRCENRLEVVPGASHLFEEPGTLSQAAGLAADWFGRHLAPTGGQRAAPAH